MVGCLVGWLVGWLAGWLMFEHSSKFMQRVGEGGGGKDSPETFRIAVQPCWPSLCLKMMSLNVVAHFNHNSSCYNFN